MRVDNAIICAKARIRHHENMMKIYDDMLDQKDYHARQADIYRTLIDEIERLRSETKKQEG